MDEIIDVLDEETGLFTGKTISKEEAHRKGIWHGAVHLIIINNDCTKTLFQKRCKDKKIYPNYWDIAVGGHISTKEDSLTTVKRELKEELGLNPDEYSFEEITKVKEILEFNDMCSKEFITTYLIKSDIDINQITLQKEEVSDVKWFTKEEVNELVNSNKAIPHVIAFDILNKRLK